MSYTHVSSLNLASCQDSQPPMLAASVLMYPEPACHSIQSSDIVDLAASVVKSSKLKAKIQVMLYDVGASFTVDGGHAAQFQPTYIYTYWHSPNPATVSDTPMSSVTANQPTLPTDGPDFYPTRESMIISRRHPNSLTTLSDQKYSRTVN